MPKIPVSLALATLICFTAGGPQAATALEIPRDIAAMQIDDKQIAMDREELVRPAPKDFLPAVGKKISLRLKLEKAELRIGEPIRFSVELVNEGSEPYGFLDHGGCFFKTGRLTSDRTAFYVKDPNGKEVPLMSPGPTGPDHGGGMDFPAGLSATQKEAWLESRRNDAKIFVMLAPGETLRTRGDTPGDVFRTMRTSHRFDAPGRYEIHAVLDWATKPGTPSNTARVTFRH